MASGLIIGTAEMIALVGATDFAGSEADVGFSIAGTFGGVTGSLAWMAGLSGGITSARGGGETARGGASASRRTARFVETWDRLVLVADLGTATIASCGGGGFNSACNWPASADTSSQRGSRGCT